MFPFFPRIMDAYCNLKLFFGNSQYFFCTMTANKKGYRSKTIAFQYLKTRLIKDISLFFFSHLSSGLSPSRFYAL